MSDTERRAHAATDLSFATKGSLWTIPSATVDEDYVADCDEGARRADEFLRFVNKDGRSGYLLGWIVRDMIANGRFTGLEVGFFSRLSRANLDHPLMRLTADQTLPRVE